MSFVNIKEEAALMEDWLNRNFKSSLEKEQFSSFVESIYEYVYTKYSKFYINVRSDFSNNFRENLEELKNSLSIEQKLDDEELLLITCYPMVISDLRGGDYYVIEKDVKKVFANELKKLPKSFKANDGINEFDYKGFQPIYATHSCFHKSVTPEALEYVKDRHGYSYKDILFQSLLSHIIGIMSNNKGLDVEKDLISYKKSLKRDDYGTIKPQSIEKFSDFIKIVIKYNDSFRTCDPKTKEEYEEMVEEYKEKGFLTKKEQNLKGKIKPN